MAAREQQRAARWRPRRCNADTAAADAGRPCAALRGPLMAAPSTYAANLRVWRGDASGGRFVDYWVEAEPEEVVLDVIHRLQATQTGDLAVRWNCKAGKCGSCSAEINGKPQLMCMTRMNLFERGATITVAPMRTFPIVRDLGTGGSDNYIKATAVPGLELVPRPGGGVYRK